MENIKVKLKNKKAITVIIILFTLVIGITGYSIMYIGNEPKKKEIGKVAENKDEKKLNNKTLNIDKKEADKNNNIKEASDAKKNNNMKEKLNRKSKIVDNKLNSNKDKDKDTIKKPNSNYNTNNDKNKKDDSNSKNNGSNDTPVEISSSIPKPTPIPERKPHNHDWILYDSEHSGDYEYEAECRTHGYRGEEPMFFISTKDLMLHHAADDCPSSWGWGFKGIPYKQCSKCGETIRIGHVHDFGTIQKQIYVEGIKCKCGMRFGGGSYLCYGNISYGTALEQWKYHVLCNGEEEHGTYTVTTDGWGMYYEATKACSCGWKPIDKKLVELNNNVANGYEKIVNIIISE